MLVAVNDYQLRRLSDECDRFKQGYAELESENAKLRELVEDMLDCIDIQIAFERVPARWMQDEFVGRARELGIEVDG